MKRTTLIEIIFVFIMLSIFYWKHLFNYSSLRYGIIFSILMILIVHSEKLAHKRRLLNWEKKRIEGKKRFILYDYVLLRGGIVSTLLILVLSIKVPIDLLIICTIIPLFGVIAFAGNEEWKKCEEQYTISTLKSVAEKIKVLQN
jgi:hypothetical protein